MKAPARSLALHSDCSSPTCRSLRGTRRHLTARRTVPELPQAHDTAQCLRLRRCPCAPQTVSMAAPSGSDSRRNILLHINECWPLLPRKQDRHNIKRAEKDNLHRACYARLPSTPHSGRPSSRGEGDEMNGTVLNREVSDPQTSVLYEQSVSYSSCFIPN